MRDVEFYFQFDAKLIQCQRWLPETLKIDAHIRHLKHHHVHFNFNCESGHFLPKIKLMPLLKLVQENKYHTIFFICTTKH